MEVRSLVVNNISVMLVWIQVKLETQSQFPSPKERLFPVPVPVKALRFENPNPNPTQNQWLFQPNPYYICNRESADVEMVERNATTETTIEDRGQGHVSSATDHSGSSSFCNNGTLSRLNSIGSGSNGHGNLGFDSSNSTHRSIREAALNKFRMKRKDRCYDKKVIIIIHSSPLIGNHLNWRRRLIEIVYTGTIWK